MLYVKYLENVKLNSFSSDLWLFFFLYVGLTISSRLWTNKTEAEKCGIKISHLKTKNIPSKYIFLQLSVNIHFGWSDNKVKICLKWIFFSYKHVPYFKIPTKKLIILVKLYEFLFLPLKHY